MPDDPIGSEELYETVRRASRDGVREALWDVLTVVIAVLLVMLGLPLVAAGASGGGPAAWLAVVAGLVITGLGAYRLYDRFGRRG